MSSYQYQEQGNFLMFCLGGRVGRIICMCSFLFVYNQPLDRHRGAHVHPNSWLLFLVVWKERDRMGRQTVSHSYILRKWCGFKQNALSFLCCYKLYPYNATISQISGVYTILFDAILVLETILSLESQSPLLKL